MQNITATNLLVFEYYFMKLVLSFFLFVSVCNLRCDNVPTSVQSDDTSRIIKVNIARDFLHGLKLPIQVPVKYQYFATDNIIVIPHKDSIEIRAINYGKGYLTFYTDEDTFKQYEINVLKSHLVDSAVSLLETNNSFIYRNYELSAWMENYLLINKLVPKFKVPLIDGNILTQDTLSSKIYFINFWYYGCPPCMSELPKIIRVAKTLQEDNQYVFLSFFKDTAYQQENDAYFLAKQNHTESRFFKLNINPLTVAINTAYLEKVFIFHGYPTSFIVDKKGVVRYVFAGAPPNIDELIVSYMEFLRHKV